MWFFWGSTCLALLTELFHVVYRQKHVTLHSTGLMNKLSEQPPDSSLFLSLIMVPVIDIVAIGWLEWGYVRQRQIRQNYCRIVIVIIHPARSFQNVKNGSRVITSHKDAKQVTTGWLLEGDVGRWTIKSYFCGDKTSVLRRPGDISITISVSHTFILSVAVRHNINIGHHILISNFGDAHPVQDSAPISE